MHRPGWLTTGHIELSKNCRFGVAVVGYSVGKDCPEAGQLDEIVFLQVLHAAQTKHHLFHYADHQLVAGLRLR